MGNINTEQTLLTERHANFIHVAFMEAREATKNAIRNSLEQDAAVLQTFGTTVEAMQSAGLQGESAKTIELKQKLVTLKKAANQFRVNVESGDVYLENEVFRVRKENRLHWEKWVWSVDEDVVFNGWAAGKAAGLDAVLTILQRDFSQEV
jgi:hypothetical protein